MEQLRQRVIASCHLGPLDGAETEAYILHRLQTVGWRDDPSFGKDTFDAIYQHSGGIPRRINILCDRLLLMGCLDEKHAFTVKDVATVTGELQQEFSPAGPRLDLELEG
jgi:type II secretory pathway predicted ATPase ExeA